MLWGCDCVDPILIRRSDAMNSNLEILLNAPAEKTQEPKPASEQIELSVVMPCLNEKLTVATCVRKALATLRTTGIRGEVIVADNGSTDGSQDLAEASGARVVNVMAKGYGNALMGGIMAANGEYVLMADADDSYD